MYIIASISHINKFKVQVIKVQNYQRLHFYQGYQRYLRTPFFTTYSGVVQNVWFNDRVETR